MRSTNRQGITLIELLLYTGLVSVFLTAAVYFAWDVIFGGIKGGVHQEVQENLRFAAHRIQVEVRGADSINTSESDFGVNLATNPGTEVTFSGSAPDYPAKFRVDQGILQIKRGVESWISLTSGLVEVSDLSFTDLTDSNSENVKFTLKIKYKNPSGKQGWEKEATFRGGAQIR